MRRLVAHVRAYLNGVAEFRTDFTTHYEDDRLLDSYDRGREHAHKVTRRKWDQTYY